jgi:hypothetical protein
MNGTEFDPGTANTGEQYIVSLTLPTAATSIKAGSDLSNGTFKNFIAMEGISGENVTGVGDYAFYGCYTALSSVDFPNMLLIGAYAFGGCLTLETVSFLNATNIGYAAFSGCITLETLSLPSATAIGERAFELCRVLETLNLPVVQTIGNGAFGSCWKLTDIIVAPDNPYYSVDGPMLLNKAGTTLIAYPSATGAVTLDNSITAIGAYAFHGCTTLETVSSPNATDIGDDAFRFCYALETVDLPEATDIGGSAFGSCTALATISLPEATNIGFSAFYGCTVLATVSLPKATNIGYGAFGNTGGQALAVTLGNQAPTLDSQMFYGVEEEKTVTVKVPYANSTAWEAAGYNATWQNAFKGRGSNSSGTFNSNIDLTVTNL